MDAELHVGVAGFVTVTTKFCVALIAGVPLSDTATETVCVDGDWAMVGRQVNTPLLLLIAALVGAVNRLKLNACEGISVSPARLVIVKVAPARTVRLEMADNVGG